MKPHLITALLLVSASLIAQGDIKNVGTNVSEDPSVRIQAYRGGPNVSCMIFPDRENAFKQQDVNQVQISVRTETKGGGFLITSQMYSRDDKEFPPLTVEFSNESPKGSITVMIAYYNNIRTWSDAGQDLATLCSGRDLPFSF